MPTRNQRKQHPQENENTKPCNEIHRRQMSGFVSRAGIAVMVLVTCVSVTRRPVCAETRRRVPHVVSRQRRHERKNRMANRIRNLSRRTTLDQVRHRTGAGHRQRRRQRHGVRQLSGRRAGSLVPTRTQPGIARPRSSSLRRSDGTGLYAVVRERCRQHKSHLPFHFARRSAMDSHQQESCLTAGQARRVRLA